MREWWLGRSGLNLEPEAVCVYGMNGLRSDINTTHHTGDAPRSDPALETKTVGGLTLYPAEPDLPTNVQAVSRAFSNVHIDLQP